MNNYDMPYGHRTYHFFYTMLCIGPHFNCIHDTRRGPHKMLACGMWAVICTSLFYNVSEKCNAFRINDMLCDGGIFIDSKFCRNIWFHVIISTIQLHYGALHIVVDMSCPMKRNSLTCISMVNT